MKIAQTIVAVLYGLLFVFASVMFLFKLVPVPPPPEGTPIAMFMGAFNDTGYMTFIKILELVGGILVVVPHTRALALLILVPISVNIVATHCFIMGGEGLVGAPLFVALAAVFLAWGHRRGLAALIADRGVTAA